MEKDFRSSVFFSDNERYADIINGFGCGGALFVRGKDLQELDARVNLGSLQGSERSSGHEQTMYRDLIRRTPFGVNFAIIGVENQEEIDYALPLRIMSYDVGEYQKQASEIRKDVRNRRGKVTSGEYLYGFCRDSRLFPTVTFVLYYGEKEWDGPKDLHGILDFTDIPSILKEKIANYQIQVIEIRKLEDTSFFRTDVKQVFDFIRFSKDKKKLRELLEKDAAYRHLNEDACDMVTAYVGEKEMLKWKEKYRKGGKIDMCQGLREWLEDERAEGRAEGREEGREEGKKEGKIEGKIEGENRFAVLTSVMLQSGKTEELLKATGDSAYREKLYQEYQL